MPKNDMELNRKVAEICGWEIVPAKAGHSRAQTIEEHPDGRLVRVHEVDGPDYAVYSDWSPATNLNLAMECFQKYFAADKRWLPRIDPVDGGWYVTIGGGSDRRSPYATDDKGAPLEYMLCRAIIAAAEDEK